MLNLQSNLLDDLRTTIVALPSPSESVANITILQLGYHRNEVTQPTCLCPSESEIDCSELLYAAEPIIFRGDYDYRFADCFILIFTCILNCRT